MSSPVQPLTNVRAGFIEWMGMHPELAIGYMGLLLFMIGDGVEAGFYLPYSLTFTSRPPR